MTRAAIIADDLTGACDTGVKLAAQGISTQVLAFGGGAPIGGAQVVAVSLNSRAMRPEDAAAATAKALADISSAGIEHVYKKIDSVYRGNVGAETAALLSRFDMAVIASALPANGRTVKNGVLDAAGLGEVDALKAVAATTDERVELVELQCVRLGAKGIAERLIELHENGVRIALLDGETEDDLAESARAIGSLPFKAVPAGSAGLAAHVNGMFGLEPEKAKEVSAHGPFLAVVGSVHPTSIAQSRMLAASPGVEVIAIDPQSWNKRAFLNRLSAIRVEKGVLLTTDKLYGGAVTEAVTKNVTDSAVAELLGRCAAFAAQALGIKRVIATGGDTALGVMNALGHTAIELANEPLPGVAAGIPLPKGSVEYIATKSGGFGGKDALCVLAFGK